MSIRKKLIYVVSTSFLFLTFYASATTLSFSENETLPVALSNTNINRIVVSHDQITHIICPTNACVSKHDNNDTSGSVYVEVSTNKAFTLFVSTANGHHVSLSVTAVKSNGKTLVLNPLGANQKAQVWETQSSYRTLLMNLIRDMMNNVVPSGYGFSDITNSSWKKVFDGSARMKIVSLWTGNYLMGVEYVLKNVSKKALVIPDSAFYHPGVRLVAQTRESVAPKDSETVYEIISR